MATLTVFNKANEVVADGLTPEWFVQFKGKWGKGCAVLVRLDCGEEIVVDTCKLFRRLPKARYKARLLTRTVAIPDGLAAEGYEVWVEA